MVDARRTVDIGRTEKAPPFAFFSRFRNRSLLHGSDELASVVRIWYNLDKAIVALGMRERASLRN
jgi:hypothetical protein